MNLKYSLVSLPCFHRDDHVCSCGLVTLSRCTLLGELAHKLIMNSIKQQVVSCIVRTSFYNCNIEHHFVVSKYAASCNCYITMYLCNCKILHRFATVKLYTGMRTFVP